jgi:hypothetical protein
MSRGLGAVQQAIKIALAVLADDGLPTRFADVRTWWIAAGDGEEDDRLEPTYERSLRRALAGLVDRGDVLVIAGTGSPSRPYHYMNVETFAIRATGKKVTSAAQAKQIVAEMMEEFTTVMASGTKRRRK